MATPPRLLAHLLLPSIPLSVCLSVCLTYSGYVCLDVRISWHLGSGPRYTICVTLFCTLRESKNLRPRENRTRFSKTITQKRATNSDTSGHCLLTSPLKPPQVPEKQFTCSRPRQHRARTRRENSPVPPATAPSLAAPRAHTLLLAASSSFRAFLKQAACACGTRGPRTPRAPVRAQLAGATRRRWGGHPIPVVQLGLLHVGPLAVEHLDGRLELFQPVASGRAPRGGQVTASATRRPEDAVIQGRGQSRAPGEQIRSSDRERRGGGGGGGGGEGEGEGAGENKGRGRGKRHR